MFPGMTSMSARGALFVTFSTDNGATWHAPVDSDQHRIYSRRADHGRRRRAVGPSTSRAWTKAAVAFRTTTPTKSSKSTDGGNHLGKHLHRLSLPRTRRHCCRLLRLHVYRLGGYWRHEGWGEPAAIRHRSPGLCPARHRRRSRRRLLHPLHRRRRDLWRAVQIEHRFHYPSSVAAQPFGQPELAPSWRRGMTRARAPALR